MTRKSGRDPSPSVAGELAGIVVAIVLIVGFLALGGPSIVGQVWAELAGTAAGSQTSMRTTCSTS
jgi:hypothetical protein